MGGKVILINGKEIDVIGQMQIDHIQYMVCKVKVPFYHDGILIRHLILHPSNSLEYNQQIEKESGELVVKDETTPIE